jgi:uroporphyrinogen decarboxylase
MSMSVKDRFLTAINRGIPDRLPVTTHHVMDYFLKNKMKNLIDPNNNEFFDYFGFDPIVWVHNCKDVYNENWIIESKELYDPKYRTIRYNIVTPKGTLTTVLQYNEYTVWVTEHLIKQKKDIELLEEFLPAPQCDVDAVNNIAKENGENALIRSSVCSFDIFGQPGCWQDASCLFGIENLIIETYDDPDWVHAFLKILQRRKISFLNSTKGANFDIIELGGGDASSTVISPKLFNEFVAPYDSVLIKTAHENDQRIAYHTCGGMMPILEDIAAMKPDAMETFTPPNMGGDTRLKEAKKRIGDKVCMIGGFDQFHFFKGCTPETTRKEVRRCFEEAGTGGGYILAPSDHFFDADLDLIKAFVDEAQKCTY